ncbi:MAG: 50S ribosomal protein L2 [Planctomycetota bacterium]
MLKTCRPTSPGRRFMTILSFEEITKDSPEPTLTEAVRKTGGRNAHGHCTMKHRGGGHRRRYRIIDFKRDKDGVPGVVASIEYDPNRSARIALLYYKDGEKRYILWPKGLKVGESVLSGSGVDLKPGNTLPLSSIPVGLPLHNVELRPGRGGQLGRSAGCSILLSSKDGTHAQLLLPSGEIRKVLIGCRATIGVLGNEEHQNVSIGKAGRNRWKGWKPTVRGIAMNPVSHPMGGGEGRSKSNKHPQSKWGVLAKGGKTRNRHKSSGRLIVRRRPPGPRYQNS